MLSLRTLARSVPRTFSRSLVTVPSAALRPGSTVSKSLFQSPLKQSAKPSYAAFSTFPAFRQAEGKRFLCGAWRWGSIEEISSVLVSPFEMGAEQANSRFVVSQVMLSLLLSWRMS